MIDFIDAAQFVVTKLQDIGTSNLIKEFLQFLENMVNNYLKRTEDIDEN